MCAQKDSVTTLLRVWPHAARGKHPSTAALKGQRERESASERERHMFQMSEVYDPTCVEALSTMMERQDMLDGGPPKLKRQCAMIRPLIAKPRRVARTNVGAHSLSLRAHASSRAPHNDEQDGDDDLPLFFFSLAMPSANQPACV